MMLGAASLGLACRSVLGWNGLRDFVLEETLHGLVTAASSGSAD
jgi:hypothetical protein